MLHRMDPFIRFSASFRSANCLHLIITVSIQLVTGEISLAKFSSEKVRNKSTLLLLLLGEDRFDHAVCHRNR